MTKSSPIRILVSHADPLTQAGLVSALQLFQDFDILEQAPFDDPDLVDVLATDHAGGVAYLDPSRRAGPLARVLLVTSSDRESDIRQALKRGVHGYVLQGCSLDELATAVRDTHLGKVHLCPPIAQRMAQSLFARELTPREETVLRCVLEGLCNKDAAKRLEVSIGTVKSHLRAVYAKLDVKSRTQAVAVARRRGILQSEPPLAPTRAPAHRQPRRSEHAALAQLGA